MAKACRAIELTKVSASAPELNRIFTSGERLMGPPPPPSHICLYSRHKCQNEQGIATLPPPNAKYFRPPPRDVLEGTGPQRRPQKRLDRRLQEVAKAVVGGYCPLQMPLKRAFGVGETVAGHRQGALEGGEVPPPFQCISAPPPP